MTTRVLLAKNGVGEGDSVARCLAQHGLLVDWVRNADEAERSAQQCAYDLVIVELGVEATAHWKLIAQVSVRLGAPLLFVAARDSVAHRACAADMGAHDYLPRPFEFPELMARAEALLHRDERRDAHVLRVGDLEVDLFRRRVERAGQRIDLTAKEYALLVILMRERGTVLSRRLIASRLGGDDIEAEMPLVDVVVRRLRRKVDEAFPRKLITLVRSRGWTLQASGARHWPRRRPG